MSCKSDLTYLLHFGKLQVNMAQNPELISEARRQLVITQERERAQKIALEIRQEAVFLLTKYGQREHRFPALVRPLVAAIASPLAALLRITPFEVIDKRTIEQTVYEMGEPIQVKLSSDFAVPKRAWNITLSVQGLEDELILRSDESTIRHHHTVTNFSNGYTSNRCYYRELEFKKIHKFREVLTLLVNELPPAGNS